LNHDLSSHHCEHTPGSLLTAAKKPLPMRACIGVKRLKPLA
jgi:hypothetical protein